MYAIRSYSELDEMASSAGSAEKAVNSLIPDLNKTNTASGNAASQGLTKFKTVAGQAGYQVQDLIVQLQSGQSAFVAIGQQGSQLAGAFGPGGAVLGAVIRITSYNVCYTKLLRVIYNNNTIIPA